MSAKQTIHKRAALEAQFSFSQIAMARGLAFLSGTAALDADGGVVDDPTMAGQVALVYADLAEQLAKLGVAADAVIKELVFTTDIDSLVTAGAARTAFYADVEPPAATWVEVRRLLTPELLIEVELVVILPD